MKESEHLKMKLPEPTDFYNVQDMNDNTKIIDKAIHELQKSLAAVPKLFHSETQPAAAGPWIWMQPVRRRELDATAVVLELSTEEIQNNDVAMQMDGALYKVENASTDPNDVGEGEYLFSIDNN